MVLLEQSYQWTPEDTGQDVLFAFTCPPEIQSVLIRFWFSPGSEYAEAICKQQIEDALTRYYDRYPREIQPMKADQFMPIKNLITISLEREGIYLGNAHRWAPKQEHLLTVERASLGFVPPESIEGCWTGMLHLHEIISPCCTGDLRIEGRTDA